MKEIPLTKNQFTIVDDDDYDYLNKFKWSLSFKKDENTNYAVRREHKHTISMHRVIMNPPSNMQVDHINGDGLDNRKENLRIVTNRQNAQNLHISKTSRYPGVDWYSKDNYNKWRSNIRVNGKKYSLGCYDSEHEAHLAYIKACEEIKRMEDLKLTIEETDFPYNIGLKIHKLGCKSSKYKGVNWNKSSNAWVARIRFGNKRYHLGLYETEEEAAHVYEVCLKYRKIAEFKENNNKN